MLILVAVTITMAVNGGLFDYAGKATGDTQSAINKEQELGSGKVTIGETTYNSIDEYINKKELPKGIKVGDYVNYIPDTGTYKVADGANGTGYTTTDGYQIFETEVDDEVAGTSALEWRILSINEGTGEIQLISATAAQNTTRLYLHGADGYNHGVDILNDLCKTLYSKTVNGKKVATARSINIEDILEKTNNTVTTEVFSAISAPNLYQKEEGLYIGGVKQQGGISPSTGLNDGVVTEGITTYSTITGSKDTEDVSLTYVGYSYPWVRPDGVREETTQPEFALKDLGINTAPDGLLVISSTWVATRSRGLDSMGGIEGGNYYGLLQCGKYGEVTTNELINMNADEVGNGFVRPVVLLDSNASLTKDEASSTDEVTYWNIEF